MKRQLHLVTFDVPFPPNYGGIIDVFYKIKELHKLGVAIYLHTFLYNKKKQQQILERYCEKVFYYPRKNKTFSFFSRTPFIVTSRKNKELTKNLHQIKAPILFEGLHTLYPLFKTDFQEKTFVRAHNIEHDYFFGLAKSEQHIFKKLFFYVEGLKLKRFEKQLSKTDGIFTISPFEQNYFLSTYGKKCTYIPAFHQAKVIENTTPTGAYILYHGDLRVADNIKAAMFLINVYKNSNYKFVIASSSKNNRILTEIKNHKNISFAAIPNQTALEKLFAEAHINTLFTFQKTGIKLKLLNALYQGKFIITNTKMIEDTGLESLCELANTKEEVLQKTSILFSQKLSKLETKKRHEELSQIHPTESARKLIDCIFK